MASNLTLDDLYSSPKSSSPSTSTSGGLIKDAGGVLKALGLGAIPDILGAGQFGVQKALAGQNPFSAQGQMPNQLPQNNTFVDPRTTGGAVQAGQDLAGAASWMVPETKVAKGGGLLADLLNQAIQGGIQGGLGAVSQGQNPVTGGVEGAITNPALTGAGNLLTDTLPRYIGFRNYGAAGAKLPEVVKAEGAAGGQTLKDVRDSFIKGLPSFEPVATKGGAADRSPLINQIRDLANSDQFTGTPGLSDLKKPSAKAAPQQVGRLADVEKAIQNSDTPFDAYNKIKNMAYAKDNTPAENKIVSFMHSAAHSVREYLINNSSNPAASRNAMDMYAAQTAMGAQKGGNNLIDTLTHGATGGGGEAALAGLAAILPMAHAATIPLALDTLLTNRISGPPLARGLVRTGQAVGNSGAGDILRRLGIAGIQSATGAGQ